MCLQKEKEVKLMKNKYYELIDEHVFEHELENGLRLFVIPKRVSENICYIYDSVWLIR